MCVVACKVVCESVDCFTVSVAWLCASEYSTLGRYVVLYVYVEWCGVYNTNYLPISCCMLFGSGGMAFFKFVAPVGYNVQYNWEECLILQVIIKCYYTFKRFVNFVLNFQSNNRI